MSRQPPCKRRLLPEAALHTLHALESRSHQPWRHREQRTELLRSQTPGPRGTPVLTSNNTIPTNFHFCLITPNCFLPDQPCRSGTLCPGWGKHSFMVSRALTLWDLLFSCASHFQSSQPPSYPPKLPSPNNRLKAIQLSPLYSVHFIFSLPCTPSCTILAIGCGGWRRNSVEGWVCGGELSGGALVWPEGVP